MEIINAVLESFESNKLFILSMQNYRNNRISKEDRLTYELSTKLKNGINIPQFKCQNSDGQEYIDLVSIKQNSISLNINDIEWALEAKTYCPHQNSNNQKMFFRNSTRGLLGDLEKLRQYRFQKNYLLLYIFEITNFEGDFHILNSYYPILSTYLGKNERQCKQNIDNVKKYDLMKYLDENLKEITEFKDASIKYISQKRQIGDAKNFLQVVIHSYLIEV